MERRRIALIAGTRPECIKLAPVLLDLREAAWADPAFVGTGQHRSLAEQTLASLGLRFDAVLDQDLDGASLSRQFGALLSAVDRVLARLRPHLVVVQGDTTSALAGAMAAFYARIPVAHVEAGLRTGDLARPFPEEFHRQAIARIADLHFAPTPGAADHLVREGVPARTILCTGNTGIDALRRFLPLAGACGYPLDAANRLVLVTTHRRENFGTPLAAVCAAINRLHDRYADLEILIPVHPNPAVRPVLEQCLVASGRIHLVSPRGYLEMLSALAASILVLTDSGGLQEEGSALGTPVLVLRDVTERPEAVAAGTARVVGTSTEAIVAAVSVLLDDPDALARMGRCSSAFGDGHASGRIVSACRDFLGRDPG